MEKRKNDLTKKNLVLVVFEENAEVKLDNVANMYKAWAKIKEFYRNAENIGKRLLVKSNEGIVLNDITGNITKNNRLWLVDMLKKKKKQHEN